MAIKTYLFDHHMKKSTLRYCWADMWQVKKNNYDIYETGSKSKSCQVLKERNIGVGGFKFVQEMYEQK